MGFLSLCLVIFFFIWFSFSVFFTFFVRLQQEDTVFCMENQALHSFSFSNCLSFFYLSLTKKPGLASALYGFFFLFVYLSISVSLFLSISLSLYDYSRKTQFYAWKTRLCIVFLSLCLFIILCLSFSVYFPFFARLQQVKVLLCMENQA